MSNAYTNQVYYRIYKVITNKGELLTTDKADAFAYFDMAIYNECGYELKDYKEIDGIHAIRGFTYDYYATRTNNTRK